MRIYHHTVWKCYFLHCFKADFPAIAVMSKVKIRKYKAVYHIWLNQPVNFLWCYTLYYLTDKHEDTLALIYCYKLQLEYQVPLSTIHEWFIYVSDNNYMVTFIDVGIFVWFMIHQYLVSMLLVLSSLH